MSQVQSIAEVTKAVMLSDLSKQIEVDVHGEILDLKNMVNGMVIWLRVLAAEVMRVTLEVRSEGKLGRQVVVPDVEGVWEQLTVNVWCVFSSCFMFTEANDDGIRSRSIACAQTSQAKSIPSQLSPPLLPRATSHRKLRSRSRVRWPH